MLTTSFTRQTWVHTKIPTSSIKVSSHLTHVGVSSISLLYPVLTSSPNMSDSHDISGTLLKVTINTKSKHTIPNICDVMKISVNPSNCFCIDYTCIWNVVFPFYNCSFVLNFVPLQCLWQMQSVPLFCQSCQTYPSLSSY